MSVSAGDPATSPLVWLLLSDKQGDNQQARALLEIVQQPHLVKRVYPKARYVLGKPWFRASVRHLDLDRSDALAPPWPDVVVTVGRRPTMAALWIRQQSGGHTRIILIGRQPRHLDQFALVIASCQYITARDPRILKIALPLDTSAPPQAIEPPVATADTAVLVGGPTRTYRLTPGDALRLLDATMAQSGGGPLRVLTSRRTPQDVVASLAAHLPEGSRLISYAPPRPGHSDYQQALAECARFVVTGDSISMICDVVRIAKPLAISRLSYRNTVTRLWHQVVLAVAPVDDGHTRPAMLTRLVRWLVDKQLMRLPRSFDAFYAFLYQHGCAADLEQGFLESYAIMREQDHRAVAIQTRRVLDEAVAPVDARRIIRGN